MATYRGSAGIQLPLLLVTIVAIALSLQARDASATAVTINWSASATGLPGSLTAYGSFVVDATDTFDDVPLNGGVNGDGLLRATVSDGVSAHVGRVRAPSSDSEMALRFTSHDVLNPRVELIDTNRFDLQNDSLVFQFDDPVVFSGGTCECEVVLLVLHGVDARNAPAPFFVSASPFDLTGTFAMTATPSSVPEPGTMLLVGTGVGLSLLRRRVRAARA